MKHTLRRGRLYLLARLACYLLTTLVTTPVRFLQTLWAARVLLHKPLGKLSAIQRPQSHQLYVYWRDALSLHRHGRHGTSPPRRRWKLPTLTLVLLLAAFSFRILAWWRRLRSPVYAGTVAGAPWVVTIMFCLLISATFYANIFNHQNYNAFGWLFSPLALFGLQQGRWEFVLAASFLSSFGSITVVTLTGIVTAAAGLIHGTPAYLLAMIPAGLKIVLHFIPFVTQGTASQAMKTIAKADSDSTASTRNTNVPRRPD